MRDLVQRVTGTARGASPAAARRIYLDCHATTPVDPRVAEAMRPYLTEEFGNAASRQHAFGWRAEAAVRLAREETARLIGADPAEIVFTSGATESNNLAIKGACEAARSAGRGDHLVTCATEHSAVLDVCRALEKRGFRISILPVDETGRVSSESISAALTPRTILISIMAANNEIGTLQPIAEIGRIARDRGVLFHCDAAQAAGKIDLDVTGMSVDLLSISAHKFYGPKGTGALYVRRGVRLEPLMDGGGHEGGLRSGTLNVPGIVGLGMAAALAGKEMAVESARLRRLRDRLQEGLLDLIPDAKTNGHPTLKLPGNLHLSIPHLESESLFATVPEIALSSGAACSTSTLQPSHVLRAIGLSNALARGSLRFGLGRFTMEEEIAYTVDRIGDAVSRLREMTPGAVHA